MFDFPGLDAAEQQLDLAYNFEDDLDNFAAAVGFVRQAVVSIVKEGDIEIDVGESTLEEGIYEPVQRILNQARAVKAPAGKLVGVVEDAVAGQFALLPEFTAALQDLLTSVSNAVDIAVQVAQRIGMHIASVRQSKEPLRLSDIDKFLAEVTVQVDAEMTPWEVISSFMERLATDLTDTLPKFRGAAKGEQVVSIAVQPPWLSRVAAIKEAAQYNAEAERKVARLSEELKEMLREVKIRDQSLQESNVKIETLGHRLESSRKQADLILDLEKEITLAKKEGKQYEDANDLLQAEFDALEAENERLRKNRGAAESGSPTTATGDAPVLASAVEAGHLVEQIDSLRSALRFLRSENALLKSKDMYNDVHMLAPLRKTSLAPLPPLAVPDLVDDSSDPESDGPRTPPKTPIRPTRQALATESKLLLRDLARMAAAPRIVDISGLGANGPAWRSRKNAPDVQVWRWENERRALEDRVQDLGRRVRSLRK
jgi:dynactin 1